MKLLDVVALTDDRPEKGLCRGQVGTIVELPSLLVSSRLILRLQGRTFASSRCTDSQLMVLHPIPQPPHRPD